MVFPSYLDQLSLSHQHAGKFLLDYWLHCHEPAISNGNLFLSETTLLTEKRTFTTNMETKVPNTNKLGCTWCTRKCSSDV